MLLRPVAFKRGSCCVVLRPVASESEVLFVLFLFEERGAVEASCFGERGVAACCCHHLLWTGRCCCVLLRPVA